LPHAVLALGAAAAMLAGQQPALDTSAAERWLASDQTSRELQAEAVDGLLARPEAGFAWLGSRLAEAQADADGRKGVEALTTHAVLEFVQRQDKREVRFAGQFEPMLPVQSVACDFLFGLLLDPPEWFPHTHRKKLVPALRDLQPHSPGEPRLGRVLAIAENEEIEPEDLRFALAAMLHQWGHPDLARRRLEELKRASAESEVDDRVRALRELAEFQYVLRDYRAAAATHRSMLALATASSVMMYPIDHYAAACACALSGDVDRGIEALRRCAELQASEETDSSHKLKRELWQTDPEIAALRRDPRYAAIFARAFGAADEPARAGR
jgi:hypothetical protein